MNKPKELQTTTQIIAREGFKPVIICLVCMLLFIFLRFEFLALFALICAVFCAFIFRNSERIASYRGNDAIIAPCDGIIKDIYMQDSNVAILFKINVFDSGIFRIPAYITRIKSAFKFGIFIKGFNESDKNLQTILNTRHKISGFMNDNHIFTITLLPEAWNKANIYALDSGESKNSPSLAEGDKGGGLRAQNNSSAKFTNDESTHPLAPSAREGGQKSNSLAFIGDRLGFMKYGYLLLEIHAPCKLFVDKGDNIFAGESLIGKLQNIPQNLAR